MQETMKYLCENIQGCVLGYTQSDEITLVLVDYKKIDSCAWFDYNIQKCASISASMATLAFNKFFKENVEKWVKETFPTNYLGHSCREADETLTYDLNLRDRYYTAISKGAMYDPIINHFVAQIGDRLYDITGDVTDKYKVVEWEHFDNELEKQRIVDYCITFTKQ